MKGPAQDADAGQGLPRRT